MRRKATQGQVGSNDGEFLWLVSFSDLLLLLFVFFVVLFSFAYQKMGASDFAKITATFNRKEKEKVDPLHDVQAKLMKWAVDKKLLDSVDINRKEDSLVLQIKEKVLFSRGDYLLKPESIELVEHLAYALEMIPIPYRIGIEGHTDDVPSKIKSEIGGNWELSSKRALEVLKALKLKDGALKRVVILGYGEMMPLLPNRDTKGNAITENQAKNRRVTIRIF